VTDSPGTYPNTGGFVSAPVFKRIAEATVRYLGVPRNVDPDPPVLVASPEASRLAALPTPSIPVVRLITDDPQGTIPDLRGMSAREAMQKLSHLGLLARVAGDGFVVAQDPPAGSSIASATVCSLTLERSLAGLLPAPLTP
jgi:hypothetical protein